MQKALLLNKTVYAIDIDTWNEKEIRNSSNENKLICPYCNEPLIFKLGTEKVSHFAHKKANDNCFYYQLSNSENNLFEEAQGDFLSRVRALHPNVVLDIAVKEENSIIDVYGVSDDVNIKIKFISKYDPNVIHKDKAVLHIYLCKGHPVITGLSSMMTDTLLYNISTKHLILYKVNPMPFSICTTSVCLDNLIITKNNLIDYSNFTGEKVVYDQEAFDLFKDGNSTPVKNTDNFKGKSKAKNKVTNKTNEFVKKSYNELYPNLYLYLLDIRNGTISLEEAQNKLSYYMTLLYQDKSVWFKYDKYLKPDRFLGADFYCIIKNKLGEMKEENIKFEDIYTKLVG